MNAHAERIHALHVLEYASRPSDATKTLALAQLVRLARDVARKKPWSELQKHSLVAVIQQIAKVLGRDLTKSKLGQIVPVVSVGIGAGFNAYYTSKVCDGAYHLYRERFLAHKYGPEILDD